MQTSSCIPDMEYSLVRSLEYGTGLRLRPQTPAGEQRLSKIKGPKFAKIAFVASDSADAVAAHERLARQYGNVDPQQADAIVALGGDGFMHQRSSPGADTHQRLPPATLARRRVAE